MKLYQQKKLAQKSLYLAVILATQSMSALADEKVTASAGQQELEEVNVKASAVPAADGYQGHKNTRGQGTARPA